MLSDRKIKKLVLEAARRDPPIVMSPKPLSAQDVDRIRAEWDRHYRMFGCHVVVPEPSGTGMGTHNAPPSPRLRRASPAAVHERMDLLPWGGVLRAARAMGHGMAQGYETEDGGYCHWKAQPAGYHLNRALRHIALAMSGDTGEEHVDHAISRLLMWGELVE